MLGSARQPDRDPLHLAECCQLLGSHRDRAAASQDLQPGQRSTRQVLAIRHDQHVRAAITAQDITNQRLVRHDERIVALSARQAIQPCAGHEAIIACVTAQHVIACTADQRVVAGIAGQAIIA